MCQGGGLSRRRVEPSDSVMFGSARTRQESGALRRQPREGTAGGRQWTCSERALLSAGWSLRWHDGTEWLVGRLVRMGTDSGGWLRWGRLIVGRLVRMGGLIVGRLVRMGN